MYKRVGEVTSWMTLRCIVEGMFEFSRGMAKDIKRGNVAQKVISSLWFQSHSDGASLSNHPAFARIIELGEDDAHFEFASPTWQQDYKAMTQSEE